MCLHSITRFGRPNNDDIIYGYQLKIRSDINPFYNRRSVYHGIVFAGQTLEIGKWFKRSETSIEIIRASDGVNQYSAGFHIYSSIRDIIGWGTSDNRRIVRVCGKGILAVGKTTAEDLDSTFVTRDILLVSDLGEYSIKNIDKIYYETRPKLVV